MEFNRAELKAQAKELVKKNFWQVVYAAFVLALIGGTLAVNKDAPKTAENTYEQFNAFSLIVVFIIAMASIAFRICVCLPLEYSGKAFFNRNVNGDARYELNEGFRKENFSRVISTFLRRDIMTLLYFLLLIVPGFIKCYEYRFVPYLTADHPEMSGKEVLELSSKMTSGSKMNLFILDLSFILWNMLSSITYNLAGIFFVFPYREQTVALTYRKFVEEGYDPTRPAA